MHRNGFQLEIRDMKQKPSSPLDSSVFQNMGTTFLIGKRLPHVLKILGHMKTDKLVSSLLNRMV